jgi:hypothetical protein
MMLELAGGLGYMQKWSGSLKSSCDAAARGSRAWQSYCSDSDCYYLKLVSLIRVIHSGTKLPEIFFCLCIYHVLLVEHLRLSLY